MGDVLNKQAVRRKDGAYPVELELSELQSHMTFFYQSLPPSLLFTMQNFRRFSKHEQASTFILLHVMFHSVITLLHQPALLRNFTPNVALPLASNVDLSRSVSRAPHRLDLVVSEIWLMLFSSTLVCTFNCGYGASSERSGRKSAYIQPFP